MPSMPAINPLSAEDFAQDFESTVAMTTKTQAPLDLEFHDCEAIDPSRVVSGESTLTVQSGLIPHFPAYRFSFRT